MDQIFSPITGAILFILFFIFSESKLPKYVATSSPISLISHPITNPVSGNIITVGDGRTELTIDGKLRYYAAGTVIVIRPGIYSAGITLQNLSDVTVKGSGVVLNGLKKSTDGFYNVLNLSNLNNVVISGIVTQNNGYKMLNLNSRLVRVTIDKCTFVNCSQGISVSKEYIMNWDGTDKTVNLLNFSVTNSTFINCDGILEIGGAVGNGRVMFLTKNLLFSGNTITGGNPGAIIWAGAVDGYSIHDNFINRVNLNNNNDNRLFQMTGNGNAYNNKFTNYEGHAIGIFPISFGSVVKTCHVYNNICVDSKRYSAFEFQEFAEYAIPGLTTKANLVVNNNICGNLNTDHWKGYPGTFIDNYQFGLMGGKVVLTNNKGYNFFPVPTKKVYWNLARPAIVSRNTYTSKKP